MPAPLITTGPPPGRLRPEHVMALGLAFLALALGLAYYEPELAPWGDNGQFIVVAKSIATGQGLREINQPDRPVHRKYPAGFPLMLAAVEWLRPDAVPAMKGLVLFQFVLATVLIFWLVLLWSSRWMALAVSLLFCSSHLALQFASEVMSEVPFVCFTVLALLLDEKQEREARAARSRVWFVAVVVAGVWALLLRSVGIALIGALCLRWLARGRWPRALILVGAAAAALGAQALVRGAGPDEYASAYVLVDYYDAARGQLTFGGLAERLLSNLRKYSAELIPQSILPWPRSGWLAALFLPLLAVGLWRGLRRAEVAAWYFAGSLVLLLAWPRIWAVPRYMVPLLPLTLYFVATTLVGGARWLAARSRRIPARAGPVAAAVAVSLVALINLRESINPAPQDDPRWVQYLASLEWLRASTPPDSVVMCRKPYLGYLHARRRTVPIPRSSAEADFLREIRKADYLVVDSLPLPGTWTNVVPHLRRHRTGFERVFYRPFPALYVFRNLTGPASARR